MDRITEITTKKNRLFQYLSTLKIETLTLTATQKSEEGKEKKDPETFYLTFESLVGLHDEEEHVLYIHLLYQTSRLVRL